MKTKLIDTNGIIRYLVEDPKDNKYQKVFDLFERTEKKEVHIFIDSAVLAEAYYVLTKFYKIPQIDVCEKLIGIVEFSGIILTDKNIAINALNRLKIKNIDFVDAFLIEKALKDNMCIYTADKDLFKSEADTEKIY